MFSCRCRLAYITFDQLFNHSLGSTYCHVYIVLMSASLWLELGVGGVNSCMVDVASLLTVVLVVDKDLFGDCRRSFRMH